MLNRASRVGGGLAVGLLAGVVIIVVAPGPDEPADNSTALPLDSPDSDHQQQVAGARALRSEPAGSSSPMRPEPDAPAAQLLADNEATRRGMLRRVIADLSLPCDEVRSAVALDHSGSVWRVRCGQAELYWVGIDEFGRWTVEPDTYSEPFQGPTGERTPVLRFPEEARPIE